MHDSAGIATGWHADLAQALLLWLELAANSDQDSFGEQLAAAIIPELVTRQARLQCGPYKAGYVWHAWAALGVRHHLPTGLERPAGPQLQTAPRP